MKNHGVLLVGILGILLSLLYFGSLYQSAEILNSSIAVHNPSWDQVTEHFINEQAIAFGVCGVIGSCICCLTDILYFIWKKKQK